MQSQQVPLTEHKPPAAGGKASWAWRRLDSHVTRCSETLDANHGESNTQPNTHIMTTEGPHLVKEDFTIYGNDGILLLHITMTLP